MKSITNFLLIALVVSTSAFAGQLTEKETAMFNAWFTDVDTRPLVTETFWKDLDIQIDMLQQRIPMPITEQVIMVSIERVEQTVEYKYFVSDPTFNYDDIKAAMVNDICADPQAAMAMTLFGAEFNYEHFPWDDPQTLVGEFHINLDDCLAAEDQGAI